MPAKKCSCKLPDKQTRVVIELEVGEFFHAEARRIKENFAGYALPKRHMLLNGVSLISLVTPKKEWAINQGSIKFKRLKRQSKNITSASWNDGHQPTILLAWKP